MIEAPTRLDKIAEAEGVTSEQISAAQKLWDFLGVKTADKIRKLDGIIILGSSYIQSTSERAFGLYKQGLVDFIVPTGGNSGASNDWTQTEAARIEDSLVASGVPEEIIFSDHTAKNMGDNIREARKLIEAHVSQKDKEPYRIGLVTHHGASMRALLTALYQWQGPIFQVTYPNTNLEDCIVQQGAKYILEFLTGEIDRIAYKYPGKYTHPIRVKSNITKAYDLLIQSGYYPRIKPELNGFHELQSS